jgi:CHAT domain-containing protein/Tfp pilus assembly protein PilF
MKMSCRFYFTLVILIASNKVVAQSLPDLIRIAENSDSSYKARFTAYDKIAFDNYLYTKPDSTFYYASLQLKLAQEKGNLADQAIALHNQAMSFQVRGNFQQAIAYYKQSMSLRILANEKKALGSSYNNIGVAFEKLGLYDSALFYYNQCITLRKELNDIKGQASTMLNLGLIYYYTDDLDSAELIFNRCIVIYDSLQLNDPTNASKYIKSTSNAYNNLGMVSLARGEYTESFDRFIKCISFKTMISDYYGLSNTLLNLSSVYERLGQYDKSLAGYKQVLELSKITGDLASRSKAQSNIAAVYNEIGSNFLESSKFDEAEKYFFLAEMANKSALRMHDSISDKRGLAITTINLGSNYQEWSRIYLNQGIFPDTLLNYAEKNYIVGLNLIRELGDKHLESGALHNLATLALYRHDTVAAYVLADSSYRLAVESESLHNIEQAERLLFQIEAMRNNFGQAKIWILSSLHRNFSKMKACFPILNDEDKSILLKDLDSDFDTYYTFMSHRKDDDPELVDWAYELAVNTKGIMLRSSTALRSAINKSSDKALIGMYESWIQLQKKLSQMQREDSEFQNLKSRTDSLEIELVKKSQIVFDFIQFGQSKWTDVRSSLKQNECVIEFIHFQSTSLSASSISDKIIYAALLIKPDSKHVEFIPLFEEAKLIEVMGNRSGGTKNQVDIYYGTKNKNNSALFDLIWTPLLPKLKEVKSIYYSPSGMLHQISFGALRDKQGAYLSSRFDLIHQARSSDIRLDDKYEITENTQFTLFGGIDFNSDTVGREMWEYLPGTLSEANGIEALLSSSDYHVNKLIGKNAEENEFKMVAPKSEVIHIATHGYFYPDPSQDLWSDGDNNEQDAEIAFRGRGVAYDRFVYNTNPLMRSGLVFAAANKVWSSDASVENDGILTAQEVSHLEMFNTKLVVLSACETGLGDIKGSEGVFGLQRAFKMAGVKYLIMSLWQVPDKETSEFMILFYKNLIKLKDIPTAFQKTQKVMREKYDPYYWGAFVLIE